MKNLGLKNPALAELVGCKPVEIWRLAQWPEKGGRQMTPAWAERLAPHLGIKPHELLFDYAGSSSDPQTQTTVQVLGMCTPNNFFERDREVPEETSNVPKIPGKYWSYNQFAYRVISSATGFGPLEDNYSICVDYNAVRKSLVDLDTVIVEITRNGFTERTLQGIGLFNNKFQLMPMQSHLANKMVRVSSMELPSDATEFEMDDIHIKIVGLVIASLRIFPT